MSTSKPNDRKDVLLVVTHNSIVTIRMLGKQMGKLTRYAYCQIESARKMIEHYFSQMIDTSRGGRRGAQDRRSRGQRGRLADGHAVALEAKELVLRVLDHLGVRRVQRPSLHAVAAFMSTSN